jgi:hypothetical protein
MPERVLSPGRRASGGLRGILDGLGVEDHGFGEIMRLLFRKMVVEAVEAQHPRVRLTMEHQLHPVNKFDDAPDVHGLICKWGRDEDGNLVEVSFDPEGIRRQLAPRMHDFAEFVVWAIRRWNRGCRATEFMDWRRRVLDGVRVLKASGIPDDCVDVALVPVQELLNVHCYLRRQPMENVQHLVYHRESGIVDIRYWGGRHKTFEMTDLLWRFVGYDGRGYGVRYTGDYRSERGRRRDGKLDSLYRALERRQDECTLWTEGTGDEESRGPIFSRTINLM